MPAISMEEYLATNGAMDLDSALEPMRKAHRNACGSNHNDIDAFYMLEQSFS